MKNLLPACYCGSTKADAVKKNGLPVLVCECGAMRQHVELDLKGYAEWYFSAYHESVYYHSYGQDRLVAGMRLDSYNLGAGSKVLDVGCGNKAFVDECLARGLDAWGQDLARSAVGDRTFVGDLHSIAFPTESFDAVTMHDVLEHVPDPVAFLKECRRILRPRGTLFLDFPRFHHPAGRHHWKETEHIWLLDQEHLTKLLALGGFKVEVSWLPIESKIQIAAAATEPKRISVLVPPGIGDSYWCLTKLPGLIQREGAEGADVYIEDSSPRRTDPYLRNVANVAVRGYKALEVGHPVRREAYHSNGRTIFPAEFGVDFFVSYNGVLTHGRSLLEVDQDLGTDWRPRTHMSKEALQARDEMKAGGKYVIAYFVDHGMYKRWLREFSHRLIDRALDQIEAHGYRVVVIGAPWDQGTIGKRLVTKHSRVDMRGRTSFDQLYGLLAGASAVVGFPSGATLLAPTLNVPTVLLWNRFFNPAFWRNSVPPDAPYEALDTKRLTPLNVSRAVADLIARSAG